MLKELERESGVAKRAKKWLGNYGESKVREKLRTVVELEIVGGRENKYSSNISGNAEK